MKILVLKGRCFQPQISLSKLTTLYFFSNFNTNLLRHIPIPQTLKRIFHKNIKLLIDLYIMVKKPQIHFINEKFFSEKNNKKIKDREQF